MENKEKIEKKESRTGAIIGAVAAIVLCGISGLCLLLPGGIAMLAGAFDSYDVAAAWGILPLCLSVIFIAIGVVVPLVLLRKKKEPKEKEVDVLPPSEPLPPAS
jgi:membrane protein implicated in regulation of membrane protease activity